MITSTQFPELSQLETLLKLLVDILDKEATIAEATRLLSEENIDQINTTISQTLDAISDIIVPAS